MVSAKLKDPVVKPLCTAMLPGARVLDGVGSWNDGNPVTYLHELRERTRSAHARSPESEPTMIAGGFTRRLPLATVVVPILSLAVFGLGAVPALPGTMGLGGSARQLDAQEVPLDSDGHLLLDPAIRAGELENGLRYFVRQNGRPEGRAELRLVLDAGSILEDEDQAGLAHFVEHMAFNGTENFEKQELVNYLESIGMQFGPSINAYTSFDETVYMLTIPTDDAEIVGTAFRILEDWADGVSFEPEEVEKERGVVLEEWRLGRGASARILDRQLPVILNDSRYADRLPIGDPEILRSFPVEALTRFYEDWYRPDLMAVIAVGDFDPDRMEDLIRSHFSGIEGPPEPRPRLEYGVPSHAETLFSIESDPEATSTSVAVLYKRPAEEDRGITGYRELLKERLYSGMFNGRLFELGQSQDPPFAFAGAGAGRFARDTDIYQIFAGVSDGGVPRGLEAALTEAERIARYGFTPGELMREQAELLRSMERMNAERNNRESASLASELVSHFLTGEPAPGVEVEYQLATLLLPSITLEELNAEAAGWFGGSGDRVVTVSAPERENVPLPTEAELVAVMAQAATAELEPWEDSATDAPLVAVLPQPAPVVEETYRDDIGVTAWTLGNGVRVLLKPTDFKDDEVVFRGFSPGGYGLQPEAEHLTASSAASLISQGGLGEFSMIDLQKVLAGKAASARPAIGPYSEAVSGSASPDDLETMFQLIYLNFAAPRKDPQAFQVLMERMRTVLANMGNSPGAAFGDTLGTTLAQGHPRAEPLSVERLDELDLDRALDFYMDRFGDASDFTFVLVGAIDLEEIRPLVERYLGGLPTAGRVETWRDTGIRPPDGVVEKTVRKGLEPQSQTAIVFTGPFEWSPEARLGMRALAGVLEIRLREVLREDLGGTYGVGVQGGYFRIPEVSYDFRIGFGSDPARTDELVRTLFAEIERLKAEGPTEDEVQKVVEAERRSRETDLRENGWWMAQLAAATESGEDPVYLLDTSLFDAVTVESIWEDARRYLNLERFVRVSLFPESGGVS
jgi:zinc protease